MKLQKLLASILIIGVLSVSSFFVMVKPTAAYCIYNQTSGPISGYDIQRNAEGLFPKSWAGTINAGTHQCCPGDNSECQGASIVLYPGEQSTGTPACQLSVAPHGYIVAENTDNGFTCEEHN